MRIDRLAFGGAGVGRLESGKVCFVPFVLPGELVDVRIHTERSKMAEADLVSIIEASKDRVDPICPVFGSCGGCSYQHVTYEKQPDLKAAQVEDVFRRLGGFTDPPVLPAMASPLEYGYRNRISVHAKNGVVGFYNKKSNHIVDVKRCAIASDEVNARLEALRANSPKDGHHALREESSFRGFRQVNDAAAALLLEAVESIMKTGSGLLVDAYCGAGFFTRRLKPKFRCVIGIEWSADAVRAARAQAEGDEFYLLGDVVRHLDAAMAGAPPSETTLLLDPPAEGVAGEVIEKILKHRPSNVVYVSCNPSTQARDLKKLGHAYVLKSVCPVDMFPQTAEIESVAVMEIL